MLFACLLRFRKLQRMAMRPNGQLVADLVAWIETKPHFAVFGAPWQADAQMMHLYKKFSWIEGIIRYVSRVGWVYFACLSVRESCGVCIVFVNAAKTAICGPWGATTGTPDTRHVPLKSTVISSTDTPRISHCARCQSASESGLQCGLRTTTSKVIIVHLIPNILTRSHLTHSQVSKESAGLPQKSSTRSTRAWQPKTRR